MGADIALYNFETVIEIQLVVFIYIQNSIKFWKTLWTEKMIKGNFPYSSTFLADDIIRTYFQVWSYRGYFEVVIYWRKTYEKLT